MQDFKLWAKRDGPHDGTEEFIEQIKMQKWMDERYAPEFEILFVECIGQPANGEFQKD